MTPAVLTLVGLTQDVRMLLSRIPRGFMLTTILTLLYESPLFLYTDGCSIIVKLFFLVLVAVVLQVIIMVITQGNCRKF